MFKIWKSIFKISQVKKVKIERFKCFLYGRLIALLLSSAIAFTSKNIVLVTDGKELSEFQSFGTIFQYFPRLAGVIFKENIYILNLLKKIISNFKKFCLKTNKNMKKIPIDILKIIELNLFKIERIAS